MNSNELRIGNWVICRNIDSEVTVIKHRIILVSTGYGTPIDVDKIFPIPLTEEWRGKLKGTKDIEYEDFDSHCNVSIGGRFVREYKKGEMFVHSIQNLYFALTGEELKVKELV